MKISRAISAAAALVIAAAAVPFGSSALIDNIGEELTDGTFVYEVLSDGTYSVKSCNGDAFVSEIPEFRNGYPVTAISERAFANCKYISEMKVPDTIKTIGDSAFAGCTGLETIKLPERLDKIAANVFMGCTRLAEIDIPDSVTTIESYSFYNCSLLKKVELPASLGAIYPMAFAECSSIEEIDASNCETYVFEEGMLFNKAKDTVVRASTALTGDVRIPDGVTTIDAGAFSVCAGIEHLYLPNSVTDIGEDAFGYCVSLRSVDFSEGLKNIRPVAFKCCYSLETVEFPKTLTEIGEGAFYNCVELRRAILNEGLEKVGDGLFANCRKLDEIILPKSLAVIGENAFGYDLDDDDNYVKHEGFTIKSFSGSAGEKYAKSNKFTTSIFSGSGKVLFIVLIGGILAAGAVFAVVLMRKGKKSAPAEVRKADKAAAQAAEDESYESILGEDE